LNKLEFSRASALSGAGSFYLSLKVLGGHYEDYNFWGRVELIESYLVIQAVTDKKVDSDY
jgi:hypothetical protein